MQDRPTDRHGPQGNEPGPHRRGTPGPAHRARRGAVRRATERAALWRVAHFAGALLLAAVVGGALVAARGVFQAADLPPLSGAARGEVGG